jgi:cytochrome c
MDLHGIPIVAARTSFDGRAGACGGTVRATRFPCTMASFAFEDSDMSLRTLLFLTPLALATAPALAQDAAAGGMAFQQCAECHSPGNSDGAGPGLSGVYGRRAGAKADFAYSPALAKSTVVWNDIALDNFLANPQKAQPGTSMNWPGDPDAKERADLIAYLKTLK